MKIVIATPLYPPEIGGPATHVRSLEKGLPAEGIEVDIVKFSDVRHLPKILRHVAFAVRVFRAAKSAAVVSAHDTVSVGVPAAFAARLAGKALVVCVPGDYAWEQATQRFGVTDSIDEFQRKHYGLRVEALRALQRFVVRSSLAAVAPSDYFGRIVEGWGISRERVRVIYNNVELPALVKPSSRPHGPLIVSAGRLVPWKGFAGLIALMPELPEWRLVIVGDGPERAALESQVHRLGMENRVVLTGRIPRAEMLGWCAVADVFVLNTSFESFSFQIVEALEVGVPVVTTAIGSLPEIIESGKEGLLVKPDDLPALRAAIESVQSDPDTWRRRVEAGKLKARRFDTKTMIDGFAALYRKAAV